MKKKKLAWINTYNHYVYKGWMYFFDKYYDFSIYGNKIEEDFSKSYILKLKKIYKSKTNFFSNFETPYIDNNSFIVVGDIFTNNLVYKFKGKNIIYYCEFFGYKKSIIKNLIFKFVIFLFFRNKKILVPTKLAYNSFIDINKKVFYLPQIYYGDINENKRIISKEIKILYVGRISNYYKNTDFLINNYLNVRDKGYNISLTLVGDIFEKDFFKNYGGLINKGIINYIGFQTSDKLREIYLSHDIFVLPSNSDPIGSVVMEAMANSLAILVSDTVGASSYIENGINGEIFISNNSADFIFKLEKLLINTSKYKKNSFSVIKNNYRYRNEKLMNKLYNDFNKFMEN